MREDRRPAPSGYHEHLELLGGMGGLSAAAPDVARLIAVLLNAKDSPGLKRETVRLMLGNAAKSPGNGFNVARALGNDRFYAQKGGSLWTSGNVLQINGDFGFAVHFAGYADKDVAWYPDFPQVMNIARKASWGDTDLFPAFGMSKL
jgi:hypothetical protein